MIWVLVQIAFCFFGTDKTTLVCHYSFPWDQPSILPFLMVGQCLPPTHFSLYRQKCLLMSSFLLLNSNPCYLNLSLLTDLLNHPNCQDVRHHRKVSFDLVWFVITISSFFWNYLFHYFIFVNFSYFMAVSSMTAGAVAAVEATFIYYFDWAFWVIDELAFVHFLVSNQLCFKCFIRLFEEFWCFCRFDFDFLCWQY